MASMTSVQYQIAHAGNQFGLIVPEMGLRQGDPLSSYQFLLCIEGLTNLLNDCEIKKMIKDVKVARSAPSISHKFFADNAYIFSKVSMESVENVLQILNLFKKASRQQINVDKSSVFFSRNTSIFLKYELCQKLKFHEASN